MVGTSDDPPPLKVAFVRVTDWGPYSGTLPLFSGMAAIQVHGRYPGIAVPVLIP